MIQFIGGWIEMVGPARIELAISHTPSADHTKLDHGPSAEP